MPASRSVNVFKGLTAEIEPIDDEPEVYFTDQTPKFKLTLKNPTEYNFTQGSAIKWVIAVGTGMPEPIHQQTISIEVPANSEREYEIGGEHLFFEGHGVVGVSSQGARGGGNPDYTLRTGSGKNYETAYTFSVWDRSHYENVHERPKKLQKIAIFLTAAVVFFSIVQLVITLIRAGII